MFKVNEMLPEKSIKCSVLLLPFVIIVPLVLIKFIWDLTVLEYIDSTIMYNTE